MDGVRELPATCTRLSLFKADFRDGGMPTEADWAAFGPALKAVVLNGARGVTAHGLAALLKACPRLEELTLVGVKAEGDLLPSELCSCPSLKSVNLGRTAEYSAKTGVTVEGVQALVRACPHLKLLNVAGTNLKSTVLEGDCLELKVTGADILVVSPENYAATTKLHKILRLGLASKKTKFSDTANKGPATCANLCLSRMNFSRHGGMPTAADWAAFPALKKLFLENAHGVTTAGLAVLTKACPHLVILNVRGTSVIGALKENPKLKVVGAGPKLWILPPECFAATAKLPPVLREGLFAGNTVFSSAARENKKLRGPGTCTKLVLHAADFGARGGMPTEADWAAFGPSLEVLVLFRAKGVTRDGVAALLKACPRLTTLDLSSADVLLPTELPCSFPSLLSVNLRNVNDVKADEITTLIKACPNLETLNLASKSREGSSIVCEVKPGNPELKVDGNVLFLDPDNIAAAASKFPSTGGASVVLRAGLAGAFDNGSVQANYKNNGRFYNATVVRENERKKLGHITYVVKCTFF